MNVQWDLVLPPQLYEDKQLRVDRYYPAQRTSDHIRYFFWKNEFIKIWQYITGEEWWFYMAWRNARVATPHSHFGEIWDWETIPVLDFAPGVKTFGRDKTWQEACWMVEEALQRGFA